MDDEFRTPPALAAWAEVDPGRHPFDPAGVAVVLRTTSTPSAEATESERWNWVMRVSEALATHFGSWAYFWHWAPDRDTDSRWVIDRLPASAEATAFVTAELTGWRRWLEHMAELFHQQSPDGAGPDELLARWEAAIAHVITRVIARSTDGDDWQGPCHRHLRWYLTANGVPPAEAWKLAGYATGGKFAAWAHLTVTDIGDISERLARAALDTLGVAAPGRREDWPDTWPRDWPSRRATNLRRP